MWKHRRRPITARRTKLTLSAAMMMIAALMAVLSAGAQAAPCVGDTFNNSVDGQWSTDGNWSDSSPPTALQVACLNGNTVTVSSGGTADSVQGGSLVLAGGTLTLSGSDDSTVADLSLDGDSSTVGTALTASSQTINVTGSFEWGDCTSTGCDREIPLNATISQTGLGTFAIDGPGTGSNVPQLNGGSITTSRPVSITNPNFGSNGAEALTTTNTLTLGPNLQLDGLSPTTTVSAAGLVGQTGYYGLFDAGLVLTGGTTTVPNNGTLEVGSLNLQGGVFDDDGAVTLGGGGTDTTTVAGGTVTGDGTLGNLTVDSGTVELQAGDQLSVEGSYDQVGGTLAVAIGNSGPGLLKLNGAGTQTIGGGMSVTDAGGYVPPAPGDLVGDIVESATQAIHGTFATPLTGVDGPLYTAEYPSQLVQLFTASGSAVAPVNTAPPVITGTPAAGEMLTCTPGTWSPPASAGYTYQWNRNGSPISGKTASTYAVVATDQGHTFTCTVIASDAAGPSAPATSAPVSVPSPAGVPVDIVKPAITGNPTPGHSLTCSTGSWSNSPNHYSYGWSENGIPVSGRTTGGYPVAIGDEGATLTCTVTASNGVGAGAPATSNGDVVAQPGTLHCPKPTGALNGAKVGPLSLGQTQSQARHTLTRFVVTHNNFDNFCLYGGWGIRVGYPTSQVLGSLPAAARKRLVGRVVLGLTANPYYALDGVRPGMALSAVAHKLHVGAAFHIGSNHWYLAPGAVSRGVLKVRGGIIQEVGVANKQLTAGGSASQRRFLSSFKAA